LRDLNSMFSAFSSYVLSNRMSPSFFVPCLTFMPFAFADALRSFTNISLYSPSSDAQSSGGNPVIADTMSGTPEPQRLKSMSGITLTTLIKVASDNDASSAAFVGVQ